MKTTISQEHASRSGATNKIMSSPGTASSTSSNARSTYSSSSKSTSTHSDFSNSDSFNFNESKIFGCNQLDGLQLGFVVAEVPFSAQPAQPIVRANRFLPAQGIALCWMTFVFVAWGMVGSIEAQTTATYIGPNNGNWSDPANWDIGVVPINNGGSTYNVIVPASKIVNFDMNGSNTISGLNLVNTGQINITGGQQLSVSGFTLVAGNVAATGAGSTFNATSSLTGFAPSPELHATNGGVIRVNGSTLTNNTSYHRTFMSSSGNGSILDLSSVVSFEKGDTSLSHVEAYVNTIEAGNGGLIDMSNTTSISGGSIGSRNDTLRFWIHSGGNIDLSSLETITGGFYNFQIDVPHFSLPNLQSTIATTFNISSENTFALASLSTMTESTLNLVNSGSVFNAPVLANVAGSTIRVDGNSSFNAPSIVNWTDTVLHAQNGAALNVSGTNFVNNRSYHTTFLSALGTGSIINMSSVVNFEKGDTSRSHVEAYVNTIEAGNGGLIDMSNTTSISGGSIGSANDTLRFWIHSGGNIDLSSLRTIAGNYYDFQIAVPNYSLPSLQTASYTTFRIDGFGVLSLPQLTALTNGRIDVPSLGTIDAPMLSNIEGTYFRKAGLTTVNMAPITNANHTELHAHSGGVIDIAASSYLNNRLYNTSFISATGANSQVNLNSASSFTFSGNIYANTVAASSTGTINLRAVETINSGGGLRFAAESGGRINIGGISESTTLTGGATQFVTTGTNSVIRFGSNMDMAANTAMKATLNGRFEAEGSLNIRATDPNNFDLKDGILRMMGSGQDQGLEIASTDVGVPTGALGNVFQIGQLQIGTSSINSRVILQDNINNNGIPTDREALYLQGFPATNGLSLLNGSSLILNGHNAYTSDGQGSFTSLRSLIAPGERFVAYDSGFISLTGEVGEVLNGDFNTNDTKGWKKEGAGTIDLVDAQGAQGFYLICTAGSEVKMSQQVTTLDEPFRIGMDAWALDASGSLTMLLDGLELRTWDFSELTGTDFSRIFVDVEDPNLLSRIDVTYSFVWNANTGDQVSIDNISMSAIPEPGSLMVLMAATGLLLSRRRRNLV